VRGRRCLIVVVALSLALVLGACGKKQHPADATAENNGFYVDAGQVTYQLQISRELNQYSTEDSQYLAGLPRGTPKLKPDELWYGVFLWAKNQSSQNQVTASRFDIVDTQGNRYYPVVLNPVTNQFAWTTQTLRPLGIEPRPDSTASFGPTQGGLVLFRLNTSVYSNRPLSLEIYAQGAPSPSTISLDL
jgi:hypothetical protein